MSKLYRQTLFSFVFLLLASCSKSQFKYQQPSKKLINQYTIEKSIDTAVFFDLSSVLPKDYSEIGKNKDYTLVIQENIDKHSYILMPDFPIYINKDGLKISSNKKVFFQKNSQIIFKGPSYKRLDDILKVYNSHNVELYNPKIKGSKFAKISQSGEWSAGISIINSKNIQIYNPVISETWGDGIFIGSEDGGFSENITVLGGWIDNARRNGISVTSAKDVWIKNILISNTSGTAPECGIDVEPSWYKDVIENINLKNIYTYNNALTGININMIPFNDPNIISPKNISINIDGHTDEKSSYAFGTSLNKKERSNYDVFGVINIRNYLWLNQRTSNMWRNPNDYKVKVKLK